MKSAMEMLRQSKAKAEEARATEVKVESPSGGSATRVPPTTVSVPPSGPAQTRAHTRVEVVQILRPTEDMKPGTTWEIVPVGGTNSAHIFHPQGYSKVPALARPLRGNGKATIDCIVKQCNASMWVKLTIVT